MLVSRLDQNGVFLEAVEYEFSDGVMVLPKGYSFSLPPEIPSGHYAILQGDWKIIEGSPYGAPESNEDAPSLIDFRIRRNELLSESDWTQLADAPLTAEQKSAWATYRQALRDIPQSEGYPDSFIWPNRP